MQKLPTLYKYISDNKEILTSIFEKGKIRFTQPWAFNDPLEFNQKFNYTTDNIDPYLHFRYKGFPLPSLETFTRMLLIDFRANDSGILSLTANRDSFDMWNMYSNGHKGFLIEFKNNFNEHPDFKTNDGKEVYLIKPVKYVSENHININEVIKYDRIKSFNYIFSKLFYVKSDRWEKEREFRMIRPLSEATNYKSTKKYPERDDKVYLFNFPLEVIQGIAFGAHMSIENKRYIIEKCNPYNIPFFQEIIIKDQKGNDGYEGHIEYLSVGRSKQIPFERIFDMLPQYFCVPKAEFPESLEKDIDNLNDLPYYKGNEIFVNNLLDLLIKYNKY